MLDASAALAWAFPDEGSELARTTLGAIGSGACVVPAHWILEVTNGLLLAERRGRLRMNEHAEILERIEFLPIRVDAETYTRGWQDIPALAARLSLTTYDAAYVELALRLDAPLATLDQALVRAAREVGAVVLTGGSASR